jgi:hypothetical protein
MAISLAWHMVQRPPTMFCTSANFGVGGSALMAAKSFGPGAYTALKTRVGANLRYLKCQLVAKNLWGLGDREDSNGTRNADVG